MTKKERKIAALAAYKAISTPAWEAYEGIKTQALEAYEVINSLAWETYEAEIDKINNEEGGEFIK